MLFSNDPLKYKVSSKLKLGKPWIKKYRYLYKLGLCVCAVLVFYFYGYVNMPRTLSVAVNHVTIVTHKVVGAVTGSIKASLSSIKDYVELHDKYRRLQEEQVLLKAKINNYDSIVAENAALKKLTKFFTGQNSVRAVKSTNIIMRSLDSNIDLAQLPIGSEDNIQVEQVVASDGGVIGRVVEVSANTSKVLLITSPSSQISAIFTTARSKAILSGNYDGKLVMTLLHGQDLPAIGELAVTSGDGGNFPPGLIIGRVSAVREGFIEVTPAFDIANAHVVYVMKQYDN